MRIHTSKLSQTLSAIALLTAVCWGPAMFASAQDGTPYEATVEEALREYELGHWDEAAALFYRAHEQNPSARTLRGLGLALYEARHYPDSIRYLQQASSDARRPLTPKQRDEVSATIERAKLFVGHLALHIEPANATVTINGQPIQRDEHGEVVTEAGSLDVEISAPDYKTMLRRLQINPGNEQSLTVRLEPEKSEPSASEHMPTVAPPPPTAAEPSASEHGGSLATWKWIATGGAIAGLGAGGAMLVAQKAAAPSYERECVKSTPARTGCDGRRTLLGSTLWDGSIIGLGLGAALAAVSVTLFVLDAPSTERAPSLACAAGPTALTCSGRF